MTPPQPPDLPEPDGDLVRIHVATSSMEAYALRGFLEAEGIAVFIKGESEGPYRMAYGPVHLFVPSGMEVQARMALAEALSGDLEVREDQDLIAETDWERAEPGSATAEPNGSDPDGA